MRTLVTLLPVPFILMQRSATHAHPGDFAPSPAYTILDVFARCCPRLSILSPLHSLVTLLRPFTRFCPISLPFALLLLVFVPVHLFSPPFTCCCPNPMFLTPFKQFSSLFIRSLPPLLVLTRFGPRSSALCPPLLVFTRFGPHS